MAYLLIVDDERDWKPFEGLASRLLVRNVADAINALTNGRFVEISLDHDLGPEEDIRSLVHWMIEKKEFLELQCVWVHSMNPVGAKWCVDMLRPHFGTVARITLDQLGVLK